MLSRERFPGAKRKEKAQFAKVRQDRRNTAASGARPVSATKRDNIISLWRLNAPPEGEHGQTADSAKIAAEPFADSEVCVSWLFRVGERNPFAVPTGPCVRHGDAQVLQRRGASLRNGV